ncbi:hypothetical protein PH547_32370 [Rhizobium sp. CNPSo 3464]|uniref:hypothetical protein n=1 Tax=Rhizobium sp. CNPSo 3464 TaxID=3021406 RepID=UPI002549EE15|nr:hypothetical protein [Rhizobium sp. CNPSo 3464]MDK4743563.1 hypothetical protein [Rhizobium sp. CNPSo 3464]
MSPDVALKLLQKTSETSAQNASGRTVAKKIAEASTAREIAEPVTNTVGPRGRAVGAGLAA